MVGGGREGSARADDDGGGRAVAINGEAGRRGSGRRVRSTSRAPRRVWGRVARRKGNREERRKGTHSSYPPRAGLGACSSG